MKAMEDQARTDRLRKKRAHALQVREQEHLRSKHGGRLVAAIAEATGKPLSLDEFCERSEPVDWPSDIRESTGLVAAYISGHEAQRLLACIGGKLGTLNGSIGFHEKTYLGFAAIREVNPASLLSLSESTEDSVVFYCENPAGVILVDCYVSQPTDPFSIVVQGEELVQTLSSCFREAKRG